MISNYIIWQIYLCGHVQRLDDDLAHHVQWEGRQGELLDVVSVGPANKFVAFASV